MSQKDFYYTNGDITIRWQPEICKHSTICFKGLGEVFNPKRRPWIDMSKADTEKIMNQIKQCPSGALSFTLNKKSQANLPLPEIKENVQLTTIECIQDGPYLIREMITIKKPDGAEETRVGSTALCRCGASKNKPYCDGSHLDINFKG